MVSHPGMPAGKHLKPMTDTESSSDEDDLTSQSALSGTDTSGIDTSSMSQSLRSSAGPGAGKGFMAQHAPGTTMPKQQKDAYPAMAFNHPKYAGTVNQRGP